MQDDFQAKKGKTYCLAVSSASVLNFDPLSLRSHTQIHLLLCFHCQAQEPPKCVPSFPLGLALTYLRDLKNASSIHKVMQDSLILTSWMWRRMSSSWYANSRLKQHPTDPTLPYLPCSL